MAHSRRGRQPDAWHRDPVGSRARQPHARAPGGLHQPGFLRRRQASGDHRQRLDAAVSALPGHLHHACRRHRHHRQVGGLGQRGDRREARDALDAAAAAADRVQRAGEPGAADIKQDRPADRAGTAARADHHHRPGIQQRLQAGHIRVPLPPGHRIQIGAGLTEGRNARHRYGQLNHAIVRPAPHREPRAGQQMQHGVVAGQHLGGEGPHAAGTGQRNQVLKQQRGDAALVHAVGDRKRDLRTHPVAGQLVTGHSHQLAAQQADQCHRARPAFQAHPPGLTPGRYPAHAEEPEVQVVRRHRLVQPPDSLVIPGAGRPDGQRGAIDQQGIGPAVPRQPGQRPPPAPTAGPVTNPFSPVHDPTAHTAADLRHGDLATPPGPSYPGVCQITVPHPVRRTRMSATTAPCRRANTGFRSSSAISGMSSTMALTLCRSSAKAATSSGGDWRYPVSSR